VPDRLTADEYGNIYVALNIAGRIDGVNADGTTELFGSDVYERRP
jgi:hypothetical protein